MLRIVIGLFGIVVVAITLTVDLAHGKSGKLVEASGVVRHGDSIFMVDDEEPGAYYRYPAANLGPKASRVRPADLARLTIPSPHHALDLEDIDILADGRLVLLSERLRAVIDERGLVVAEYGPKMAEVGGRGLEGLAVLHLENDLSRLAVLWEGGKLKKKKLAAELATYVEGAALNPVIWIHDIASGAIAGEIKEKKLPPSQKITLQLPTPMNAPRKPFRAPGLVWYRPQGDGAEAGQFIVLLNRSEDMRLQRFDGTGHPVGAHYDLNAGVPDEARNLNWEGLGWFVKNETLILVDDTGKNREKGLPYAMLVDLPKEW